MAGFTCAHGETYPLFGEGGGTRLSAEIGAPLLASVPIDPLMAIGADVGRPAALDATTAIGKAFAVLAEKITTEVSPIVAMSSCSARMIEALEEALSAAND